MSLHYYSLAEARADGIPETYSDEQVTLAIAESEALFERITARKFYERTLTLDLDGDNTRFLYIREYPIISITSLKIDTTPIGTDFYEIYIDSIKIKTGRYSIYSDSTMSVFTRGEKNIEVVGVFGYVSTDPIFLLVKRAIRKMVMRNLTGDLTMKNFKSEKVADHTWTLKDDGSKTIFGSEIDIIIKRLSRKMSLKIV